MKKLFSILLAILGAATGAMAQTSSFNFSAGTNPVSGWINVHGDPSDSVITATDATTGYHISSVAVTNWYQYNRTNAAYDGGGEADSTTYFFPKQVMQDEWFQYNPAGSGYAYYSPGTPQLVISGLNVDSVYTVKISGSNSSGFDANPSQYSLTGAFAYGVIDVNTQYNSINGASFYNIAPDSAGRIKVYVNTTGNTEISVISGLQITAQRTAVPLPQVRITSPANNDILAEDGNVVINATASESGGTIQRVEFYNGSSLLGSATSAPYKYTWLNPDEGTYSITARAIDGSGVTNTSTIHISVQSLSGFWSMTGNIGANGDSNFVGTVDTNRLSFRTNNVERMTILKDGTIGIGTKNTYGYQLAVNGTAIFTKAKVKTAGTWPDYVFKKDYRLPGLEELEKYISHNHHLPGIDPASIVQKEGIDLGDQQTVLLKKVEELTLYVIQQNKALADQNAQLQAQQREIDDLKKKLERKEK